MKIARKIISELEQSAAEYPVVTILGPRQSGKTTVVRHVFSEKPYYSLENPDTLERITNDPRGFFAQCPDGAIIDEVQNAPELLSYIQGIVDEKNEEGHFILTGSHQPRLHDAVNQSLAGRTSLTTLLPFSMEELRAYNLMDNVFDYLIKGSYPRLYDKKIRVKNYYASYVQTYIERDVRELIAIQDLRHFQTFMRLVAGRVGQVVNYSSLSNDVGVDAKTIKSWIEVLKASYVLFELPPWFENIGKRVIKSPKIFFYDTGVLCYLLGIHETSQLEVDPKRGNLFENLVILEYLKSFYNHGDVPEFYFYKDTNGNEVDLIIRNDGALRAFEIKSASTFTNSFVKGLTSFNNALKEPCELMGIIYNGEDSFVHKGIKIFNPFKSGFKDNL